MHATHRALQSQLAPLPPSQQRVALALVAGKGRTYQGTADALGLSVGTVYTHLKRIRDKYPEVYRALMTIRREQLDRRHARAVKRARAHTDQWFRKKRARAYKYLFGVWPWER